MKGEFRTGGAIPVFPSVRPSVLLFGNYIPCLTAIPCTVLILRIIEIFGSNPCVFDIRNYVMTEQNVMGRIFDSRFQGEEQ
jgi:hypothetical protein